MIKDCVLLFIVNIANSISFLVVHRMLNKNKMLFAVLAVNNGA